MCRVVSPASFPALPQEDQDPREATCHTSAEFLFASCFSQFSRHLKSLEPVRNGQSARPKSWTSEGPQVIVGID